MILIYDFFETLLNNRSIDFNRGLKVLWEQHYRDKCPFEDIKAYGEELFVHLQDLHKEGKEFPFVKEELPLYAKKYGGEAVTMDTEEETDFLMRCNELELLPGVKSMLEDFAKQRIPMYVLSNSGFTSKALWKVLDRFDIGKYFSKVWSSADFGRIKPCKEFFDQALQTVLTEHSGERKEDVLFIGDMYETDVTGAHNAGLKAVWINRKNEPDKMHYATYEINETNELKNIVDSLLNDKDKINSHIYSLEKTEENHDRIKLVEPGPEYAEDIWAFRQEVLEKDADNEDQFAGCLSLDTSSSAEEWIQICSLRKSEETCNQVGTEVPSHMYLAVRLSDNRIVGIIDLRHHINHPILGTWGGHCGYTVRPSERGKGYAKEMLRQNIQNAKALGIEKMLVTCNVDNTASEKTILANGGVFESIIEVDGSRMKRYWISRRRRSRQKVADLSAIPK